MTEKEEPSRPSRKEMIEMLQNMAKEIDRLPEHAMYSFVSQYDFYRLVTLLVGILQTPE